MTNLKKLSKNLNLKILNSTETTNLKGGRKFTLSTEISTNSTKTKKPIKGGRGGGGAGLPPTLDSMTNFI
ncbi:MAG: hypothetical protein AB8H03_25830 [Saprospiraceae bacterium]